MTREEKAEIEQRTGVTIPFLHDYKNVDKQEYERNLKILSEKFDLIYGEKEEHDL